MKTGEHYGIGANTAKGALVIFFGAICFASGYHNGWEDRAKKIAPAYPTNHSKTGVDAAKNSTPTVKPSQSRSSPLPPNHPPIPESDEHGHPSFDCRALKATVTQEDGTPSIDQLYTIRKNKEGDAISLKAIVVGAYYKILGTNWYHLCDAPRGQVLVVSSDQLVKQRTLVTVDGTLNVDFDLSGVYRFPLYIKDAQISGKGVKDKPKETPQGVMEL